MFKRLLPLVLLLITLVAGCIDMDGLTTSSYSNVKSLARSMVPRWTLHGADIVDVNNTLDRISLRQGNWVQEWEKTALDYQKKAEDLIKEKDFDNAKYLLMKSSVYYRLAAFPYPLDPTQNLAYKKCVKQFAEANKFFSQPPERKEFTFEGKRIIGNFRKPLENKRYPLVILIPGLDSNKEEMYWIEDRFLSQGWATFSVDMPGTGESEWPLRVESDRVFQAVFSEMQRNSYILKDKIIVIGFNFGGYWAVRLAAQEPEVMAVVDVAGPIHYTFQSTNLNKMPGFMQTILKKASGEKDYAGFAKIAGDFSLKKNDLLQRVTCPCLVISSKSNFFVPADDAYIFSEVGNRPATIKMFTEDEYGFSKHLSDVYALILDWIEQFQPQ